MVDSMMRVDPEILRFLDAKKLIERESYKSVLKRLLHINRFLKGGKANGN